MPRQFGDCYKINSQSICVIHVLKKSTKLFDLNSRGKTLHFCSFTLFVAVVNCASECVLSKFCLLVLKITCVLTGFFKTHLKSLLSLNQSVFWPSSSYVTKAVEDTSWKNFEQKKKKKKKKNQQKQNLNCQTLFFTNNFFFGGRSSWYSE